MDSSGSVFTGYAFVGLVAGLICGILGMNLASHKGNGTAGFWLGAFLGPIGVVIALLLPEKTRSSLDAAVVADFAALVRDKGKTGIGLDATDGRTINAVAPESSAQRAGVLPGDRIIAIDGELCEGDHRQVVLRLVGDAGTRVNVSVRRGEARRDFELLRT